MAKSPDMVSPNEHRKRDLLDCEKWHQGGPLPKASIELPRRSTTGEGERPPAFCIGTENGPSASADEERRHSYRRNGNIVRVKIKRRGGGYVNWYRVLEGWQAGKPEGYDPCPYTGEFDALSVANLLHRTKLQA